MCKRVRDKNSCNTKRMRAMVSTEHPNPKSARGGDAPVWAALVHNHQVNSFTVQRMSVLCTAYQKREGSF